MRKRDSLDLEKVEGRCLSRRLIAYPIRHASNIPYEMQAKMIHTWLAVDKDCSGTLNLPEITKLVNRLNVPLTQSQVKKHFKIVDINK